MTQAIQLKVVPFGMYQFLERLAIGGMAEVYLAYLAQKTDFGEAGDLVAVKRILPSIAESDEFIAMFIDEAKIAGQLHHKNIAPIYDIGKITDSYYLTMEYITGHDVRAVWDAQRYNDLSMNLPLACYLCQQICEGLDYAHHAKDASGNSLGIIHRDVSPQNILVHYDGEVKIIDFGIAKSSDRMVKTRAGILKGKFAYMAPEQAKGDIIDARADIFAIGVIFYELLTGHRAFEGATDFAILEKVRRVHIAPPRKYNDKITRSLEKVLQKALARDVKKRYSRAQEMADDLRRVMQEENWVFGQSELKKEMRSLFKDEFAQEKERQNTYRRFWLQENKVFRSDTVQANINIDIQTQVEKELVRKTLRSDGSMMGDHDKILEDSSDEAQRVTGGIKGEMRDLGSIAHFDDDSQEDETLLAGRGRHFGERPDTKKVNLDFMTEVSSALGKTKISRDNSNEKTIISDSSLSRNRQKPEVSENDAEGTFKELSSEFSKKESVLPSDTMQKAASFDTGLKGIQRQLSENVDDLQTFFEVEFNRNIDKKLIVFALCCLPFVIVLLLSIPSFFSPSTEDLIANGTDQKQEFSIPEGSPNVVLSTEPAGAKVLEGDALLCILTPCAIEMSHGEHQLRFKHQNFDEIEKKFEVLDGQLMRQHLPFVKKNVELTLKVEPKNADVYIDKKKLKGKKVISRKPGEIFSVEIKLDGFKPIIQKITANKDQLTYDFKMQSNQTVWKLEFSPHNSVVTTDEKSSQMMSQMDVKIENNNSKAVLVEYPGCKSKLLTLGLNEKSIVKKKVRLVCPKSKMGMLSVKAKSKLSYTISGVNLSKFRYLNKFKLPPGRHAVSISGRRNGDQIFVDIKSGKLTTIRTKVR